MLGEHRVSTCLQVPGTSVASPQPHLTGSGDCARLHLNLKKEMSMLSRFFPVDGSTSNPLTWVEG